MIAVAVNNRPDRRLPPIKALDPNHDPQAHSYSVGRTEGRPHCHSSYEIPSDSRRRPSECGQLLNE